MTVEQYKSLGSAEKIFADLLTELIRQVKRAADLLEESVKETVPND